MDDFEALETDLTAPFAEISSGVVEGFAEFDEHVERHQKSLDVLPAGVVDQRLDRHERAAGRQGVVGGTDEVHLLLQIPIVENHSHCDDVGLGKRVLKKISGRSNDSSSQTGGGDMFLRD